MSESFFALRRNLLLTGPALVLTTLPGCATPARSATRMSARVSVGKTLVRISSDHAFKASALSHNGKITIDTTLGADVSELRQYASAVRLASPLVSAVQVQPIRGGKARITLTLSNAARLRTTLVRAKDFEICLDPIISRAPNRPASRITQKKQPARRNDPIDQITRNMDEPPPAPARKTARQTPRGSETLIVVIDAGHGGQDPGAVGLSKTYEKHVVLSIARALAQRINATHGMKAILTRNSDIFLPLYQRANMAVRHKAHIFISIHADAWTSQSAHGASVFTLSLHGASSLQARWLAQTQNKSDEIGGMNFKHVAAQARSTVVDMLAETKLRYGLQLGAEILSELNQITSLHKDEVESAEFAVLKAQGIPSVLVESGFLSNARDEKMLNSPAYQKRVAESIYRGIVRAVRNDPSLLRQA